VVRICLYRQLPDVKRSARQGDGLLQLVDQDRRRAAPDIDRPKVIPEVTIEEDLLAERAKIAAAGVFRKDDAVE